MTLSSMNSGVYRTPADTDSLQAKARSEGFAWVEVALGQHRSKQDALAAIADAVGAPRATFGANFDALADVLQDLTWRPASGQALRLRGFQTLDPAVDRATLLDVLRTSAVYWKAHGMPFFVFIDDAPELPEWP